MKTKTPESTTLKSKTVEGDKDASLKPDSPKDKLPVSTTTTTITTSSPATTTTIESTTLPVEDLVDVTTEPVVVKKREPLQETYDLEVENDYATGMSKLNASAAISSQGVDQNSEKELRLAYQYLAKAAARGHTKAREELAIASLFGDHVTRNLTAAREIFEDLAANKGTPRSQFFLGFMHAAGLGVRSSQAKALTYMTFAALGGEPMAQMALGYRYWAGVGVVSGCELALNYYKRVAASVTAKVSTNSVGAVVHRIRLYDEEEKIAGQSQVMLDDDLVQYYQLLADRGDIQAQYGLGLLHYQGARGLHIQYDKALHYFSRAAEAVSSIIHFYSFLLFFKSI